MSSSCASPSLVAQLQQENAQLKQELEQLRAQLKRQDSSSAVPNSSAPHPQQQQQQQQQQSAAGLGVLRPKRTDHVKLEHSLSNTEVMRYGRQLILDDWGVKAQCKVKATSVLVVGAGGLGCPVLLYLAAAGIGHLGIVDGDRVELDNLHRQVMHRESTLGQFKSVSARSACQALNSDIKVTAFTEHLSSANALEMAKGFDILVDATDNVATRYLINDVGILLKKPVVSGSALRLEGQVTVYGYKNGPCYRCIYPTPPPPHMVTNCSDGGVLGVVPGIIGCYQAMEVLKIAAGFEDKVLSQKLLLFDAMATRVMVVKLRPRSAKCAVCGDSPSITSPIDYVQFCGAAMNDKAVATDQANNSQHNVNKNSDNKQEDDDDDDDESDSFHISANTFHSTVQAQPHVLLDVRMPVQYEIAALPGSSNIPLVQLDKRRDEVQGLVDKVAAEHGVAAGDVPVVVLCRRGVDSVKAVQLLRSLKASSSVDCGAVRNLAGGLLQWTAQVDAAFPMY